MIHPHDHKGTKQRLAVARKVLGNKIGISTECGLGRTNREWSDSVLEIAGRLQ